MAEDDEGALERLEHAFARYETAFASDDRAERVTARVLLCRALVATGWTPPVEVRDQLWRDERVLRELEQQRVAEPGTELRPPSHRPPGSTATRA